MLRVLMAIMFIMVGFSTGPSLAITEPSNPEKNISAKSSEPTATIVKVNNSENFSADTDFTPRSIVTTRVENLSLPQLNAALMGLSDNSQGEAVLATDNDQIVNSLIAHENSGKKPFAKTVLFFKNVEQQVKQASSDMKHSATNDKFGLIFTVISFAYDSLVWIQASNMTNLQKIDMISFNLLIAASFGINKDLWARATKPVENRVKQLLEHIGSYSEKTLSSAGQVRIDLAAKFSGSFALSLGIQVGRMIIYNGNELFSSNNLLHMASASALLAGVLSLSQFAWDEQIALVDSDLNPSAKFLLRRLKEIRGLTMGLLAPSSKLIQTGSLDAFPWIISVVHGGLGILTYLNSSWLAKELESINLKRFFIPREASPEAPPINSDSKNPVSTNPESFNSGSVRLRCESVLLSSWVH